MKYKQYKQYDDSYLRPTLVDGVVVDTSDPQEQGRLKVWCPAVDGDNIDISILPWALYVSPLAGQAYDYPAGGSGGKAAGPVSYGFWAPPKLGAKVLISFLHGDYSQRVFMGCIYGDFGNRSLPVGRNTDSGAPVSDSSEVIEPQYSNLKAQFQGDFTNSIARTRGVYERQVAQAATEKTNAEGYSDRVIPDHQEGVGTLESQTYCITTPGRHSVIFQDNPTFSRVRVKSAEGHQVILDDANERIYISPAGGNAWVEIDKDGHVQIYAGDSISLATAKDFNISADGSVNIAAGANVNIAAKGYARISACSDVSLSGDGGLNLTSGGSMNFLASSDLLQTGSNIHLNGQGAATAPCAVQPSIVPNHEPWTRPASSGTRGPNWKA